jgi:hypothetical protein
MPLPEPSARQLTHTRSIACTGYKRQDGLFDIEGHLVDTKPFAFDNKDRGGRIGANEPLHEMHVRITLDLDLLIHDAIAVTEWGPFQICKNGADSFNGIIGIKIGPGWRREIKRVIGATAGCTHITELLGQMATTAFQTMGAEWSKKSNSNTNEQPRLLNSCFAFADDGPVVQREWPLWYKAKPLTK